MDETLSAGCNTGRFQVHAGQRMPQRTTCFLEDPTWSEIALLVCLKEKVLRRIETDVPGTPERIPCERKIGMDQVPAGSHRGIIDVQFPESKLACFKPGSSTPGIDDPKIGLHAKRFGRILQKTPEILHSCTNLQGLPHQNSLAVPEFHGVVFRQQIIGGRINNGETR